MAIAASTIRLEPFAAEIAARQYVAQLVLAAPQEFLEIGRRRSRLLRPRAPRTLAPSPSSIPRDRRPDCSTASTVSSLRPLKRGGAVERGYR